VGKLYESRYDPTAMICRLCVREIRLTDTQFSKPLTNDVCASNARDLKVEELEPDMSGVGTLARVMLLVSCVWQN
jgi:hypothetical protein